MKVKQQDAFEGVIIGVMLGLGAGLASEFVRGLVHLVRLLLGYRS